MCAKRKKTFNPFDAKGPRKRPDVGDADWSNLLAGQNNSDAGPQGLSVSELIGQIKSALSGAFPGRVTVIGELSNVSRPASGHVYFSLKDANASIGAAMWRSRASRLKFDPTDGLEVVVEAQVDIYDVQGKLQLYVDRMTPCGQGALELAFQQLKDKLQAEGLFESARKKPIPRFPRAIGVVTSATGAAIRDIQRTLRRRWPVAKVYLIPAMVQGDGAAEQIAQAITLLDQNADTLELDTIIVGRGGGSLEDLWAFNEEPVARAIAVVNTPIISGVGHEVDVTISDMVADVRAATPTAAAEMATPDGEEMRRVVEFLADRMQRRMSDTLAVARAAVEALLRSTVFRDPAWRIRSHVQRMDELEHRLNAGLRQRVAMAHRRLDQPAGRLLALHPVRLCERADARLDALVSRLRWVLGGRVKHATDQLATMDAKLAGCHPKHRLRLAGQQLDALQRHLDAMSYQSVLARGFSVTRCGDGKIVRTLADVSPGVELLTELAEEAIIHSRVENGEGSALAALRPSVKSTRAKRKPKNKAPKGPTLFD